MQSIKRLYGGLKLDRDTVIHKAKLLLKVYREVVWVAVRDAEDFAYEADDFYGSHDLGLALTYLADFAPTEQRRDFEERVSCLFETQWLVELIDKAMRRVCNYPYNGKMYSEILSKSYMTALKWTESELLETLNIERSIFYERKKEAVMLLGVALWGYVIPELRNIYA
jgi:hypothetical protein